MEGQADGVVGSVELSVLRSACAASGAVLLFFVV